MELYLRTAVCIRMFGQTVLDCHWDRRPSSESAAHMVGLVAGWGQQYVSVPTENTQQTRVWRVVWPEPETAGHGPVAVCRRR